MMSVLCNTQRHSTHTGLFSPPLAELDRGCVDRHEIRMKCEEARDRNPQKKIQHNRQNQAKQRDSREAIAVAKQKRLICRVQAVVRPALVAFPDQVGGVGRQTGELPPKCESCVEQGQEEVLVVAEPHCVADPGTVVVHLQHALPEHSAVVRAVGLVPPTPFAVAEQPVLLRLEHEVADIIPLVGDGDAPGFGIGHAAGVRENGAIVAVNEQRETDQKHRAVDQCPLQIRFLEATQLGV
mmetsp:Transcript_2001/g.4651  ORF Transcript_2001/g.4651 Transcript_2001/m.4651 type:complete len:239 (-) Transcript_2001:288-1004(-)